MTSSDRGVSSDAPLKLLCEIAESRILTQCVLESQCPSSVNETFGGDLFIPLPKSAVFATLTLINLAFVISANVIALISIRKPDLDIKQNSKLFLKALFITQIFNGILVSLGYLEGHLTGRQRNSCRFVSFTVYASSLAVFLLVCCENANRYLLIIRPLRYAVIFTHRRAKIVLLLAGILLSHSILILPIPGLPYHQVITRYCSGQEVTMNAAAKITFLILQFILLLPIIITGVINTRVFFIAVKQSRSRKTIQRGNSETRSETDNNQVVSDLKRFRVALGITFVTFGCWLPSIFLYFFATQFGIIVRASALHSLLGMLCVATCWLNVLALLQTNAKFKQVFLCTFKQPFLLCKRQPQVSSTP